MDLGQVPGRGPGVDAPDDLHRHELGGGDRPGARTGGALPVGAELQRLLDPLPVDLHEPVVADPAQVDPGLVGLGGGLDRPLHLPVVTLAGHVDEVDHHQPPQIAESQLSGDLRGGLHVGLECGLLLGTLLGGLATVDVDGDQRLGGIDDDRRAGRELDAAVVDGLDLLLEAEVGEQGSPLLVQGDLALGPGHHGAEVLAHALVRLLRVDDQLVHLAGVVVPDHTLEEVALLVQHGGGFDLASLALDLLPELDQGRQVSVEGGLVHLLAGGADDEPHALGHGELAGELLELLTLFLVLDLAADPPGGIGGHQHEETTGEGDLGRQGWPLAPHRVPGDLDDDVAAALDHLLDARSSLLAGLLVVGVRDDVVARQEPLALDADLHEAGIQAALHVGDLALVYVALDQVAAGGVDLEDLEDVVAQYGSPDLLGSGRIEQHSQ